MALRGYVRSIRFGKQSRQLLGAYALRVERHTANFRHLSNRSCPCVEVGRHLGLGSDRLIVRVLGQVEGLLSIAFLHSLSLHRKANFCRADLRRNWFYSRVAIAIKLDRTNGYTATSSPGRRISQDGSSKQASPLC